MMSGKKRGKKSGSSSSSSSSGRSGSGLGWLQRFIMPRNQAGYRSVPVLPSSTHDEPMTPSSPPLQSTAAPDAHATSVPTAPSTTAHTANIGRSHEGDRSLHIISASTPTASRSASPTSQLLRKGSGRRVLHVAEEEAFAALVTPNKPLPPEHMSSNLPDLDQGSRAIGGRRHSSRYYVNAITIVIFLEFFAWGLVTTILPQVFSEFYGDDSKWIVLGLTQGLKGFLSFLSAPIIGAFTDTAGRKWFLLLAVATTCLPIPFLLLRNLWWHVVTVALSGISSVTFSIVFAYVSDVTTKAERSAAYGQVSATFAASLVISPALGSLLQGAAGFKAVYIVSSIIALVDVIFIVFWVPESLTVAAESSRKRFDWEQASPFTSLKVVFSNKFMLQWSVIVFFSYLPEAGQYQCLIMYLQSIGFTQPDLASFIAFVGILSIVVQTWVLSTLSKRMSQKAIIIIGLIAQAVQLALYGVFTGKRMMFVIGTILAFSSLNYPAVSALLSHSSSKEQQGAVQGMITGIRSLCTGLGPAIFGSLFQYVEVGDSKINQQLSAIPGAPFLIGCGFVFVALFVAMNVTSRNKRDLKGGDVTFVADVDNVLASRDHDPALSKRKSDDDHLA